MKPTVVLLHGLGRTHRSLAGLRRTLASAGYATWARSYPSRRAPVAEIAAGMAARIQAELPGLPLVAVTHSLGGILVRHMPELPWRGVVMMAPPNQGSRVALALKDRPFFHLLCGPAGQDLCGADTWPPPPAPFAVIAGTHPGPFTNPTSWLTRRRIFALDEANDGTLAVDETRLPGMAAFATVRASHTWIMNHRETKALVLRFLATGNF